MPLPLPLLLPPLLGTALGREPLAGRDGWAAAPTRSDVRQALLQGRAMKQLISIGQRRQPAGQHRRKQRQLLVGSNP
jgi:hypothetical protein